MTMLPSLLLQGLKDRLLQPLPGGAAHAKMAHQGRRLLPQQHDEPNIAGVLILIFPSGGNWKTVLIERTSHNKHDKHKGQISFPGGRRELSDQSILETATREAEEEVGVNRHDIQVAGRLSDLYIPVSNFLVTPVVGLMAYEPRFKAQETEVAGIIQTSFEVFEAPKQRDLVVGQGIKLTAVPYFEVNGHVVWGATAMILSEFVEVFSGVFPKF